jgi:hypothetical protein
VLTLPIEDGTVQNINCCYHRRGKNWVATVHKDLSQPGGLARAFWRRGPSDRVFYQPVEQGNWLEFAGDYYTGGGSKRADRKYFRVVSITDNSLELEECTQEEVGRNA